MTTQLTGPEPLLRDATERDSSDLAILADAAARRLVSWTWSDQAQDGQSSFEVGRNAIRSDTTSLSHISNWAVAEVEDSVAGGLNSYLLGPTAAPAPGHLFSVLEPLSELKSAAEGTWYVSVASVFPEFQSRGIGNTLLSLAEVKASAAGATQVTLVVGSFNPNAQRLYLRVGFSELQRRRFNPFPGSDRAGDWILMGKDL